MKGHLILIVGPSGSGKGSILSYLRHIFPQIPFAISCTTRAPRPGEENGSIYYFVTEEEFRARIAKGEFVEWASYGGHLYGTLKSEIIAPMEEGRVVIREVDVQGARTLQKLLPKENLTVIFLDAGSWEEMERRITERAPIASEELIKRRERYIDERTFLEEADHVISNHEGQFDEAKQMAEKIVGDICTRTLNQP